MLKIKNHENSGLKSSKSESKYTFKKLKRTRTIMCTVVDEKIIEG